MSSISTDSTFWKGVVIGGVATLFGSYAIAKGMGCCQPNADGGCGNGSGRVGGSSSGGSCSPPPAPGGCCSAKKEKVEVEVEASTTDSGLVAGASGGAGNVYETTKAVNEYLLFHYADPSDVLPYVDAPHSALNFPKRTADIAIEHCTRLGLPMERALDVGCAVGAASFHLASGFDQVVGIDFSHAFVAAANAVKASGTAEFSCVVEAEITRPLKASVPASIDRSRCEFEQGDACNIRRDIGKFSVIHAVNLLCRLPDPKAFLERLPSLLVPGGIVVLISPYSWMPGYTDREKWVGGFVEDLKPHYSRRGVMDIMEPHFKLVEEKDVPFLIREHARKFQWGCSHGTVWQLR